MTESWLIKPKLDEDYPEVTHGVGCFLYDKEGKRYLDGSSGAVTASIGHSVPEVIEAMQKQAEKVSFVYRSQFTSDPAEKLAKRLSDFCFDKEDQFASFFVNSGSEAAETALKIAIQYWQEKGDYRKNKIISRWSSYHGITLGALSMSGHVGRRDRFVPLLEGFPTISPPYCYRCPFYQTYPSCQLMCADELDLAIRREGAEHIAAFIAEPIVGAAGGIIVPPEGYYERIREICDQHEILFIADEVMTGIGRTGKMLGMEHWNAKPDIFILGKGLSAGYTPLAATLVSEKVLVPIMNGSKSIMSGHTFSANPQSTAVGLAVLNYIENNNLVQRSEEKGKELLEALSKMGKRYPIIGDVRGKGLLIGVEFVSNVFSKLPFRKELTLTERFVKRAMDNGLLLYPAKAGLEGGDGDAVIVSPPLTISKEEMELLLDLFEKTIKETQRDLTTKGMMDFLG